MTQSVKSLKSSFHDTLKAENGCILWEFWAHSNSCKFRADADLVSDRAAVLWGQDKQDDLYARSWYSLSYSGNSLPFMGYEGSLTCLHKTNRQSWYRVTGTQFTPSNPTKDLSQYHPSMSSFSKLFSPLMISQEFPQIYMMFSLSAPFYGWLRN